MFGLFRTAVAGCACAAVIVVMGAGTAPAQSLDTRPAATRPAETDVELKQCMQHCRVTFTSIEQTLRLIDRAQSSPDPEQTRDALRRARVQLLDMREHMSRCMLRLEKLRDTGTSQVRLQASAGVDRSWICPMHTQVRQDMPGNCPICDARLRAAQEVSTRPAIALSPEDADHVLDRPARRWTAGR